MSTRGSLQFEIDANGHVIYNQSNSEKLQKTFLDREIIKGKLLGPGDDGDFDFGGWHVLCHLVAGCAVFKKSDKFIWVEISHVTLKDEYIATLTVQSENESVVTFPLLSDVGQSLIKDAKLLGFVEGSSLGHISARDVIDEEGVFNTCTRQEYNMEETSPKDGGRVWEHWTTTRNITTNKIGISVLNSYLSLVALCGDKYVSIVARGRDDYFHPDQLKALIHYGFISSENANVNLTPKPIPKNLESLIYSANPIQCLKAVQQFPWDNGNSTYWMFERKISKWNSKPI